jgi:hypothetical protein
MSAQLWLRSIAVKRRLIVWRYRLAVLLAAAALLTQGCAPVPPRPFVGTEVSDSNIRVPSVAYRPVLGSYSSQRPVAPMPWRERNDRVAPSQKQ